MYKTLEYWSRDMLIFDFLEKSLKLFLHNNLSMNFQENVFRIMFY